MSAKPLVSPTAAVDHKVYARAETCCLGSAGMAGPTSSSTVAIRPSGVPASKLGDLFGNFRAQIHRGRRVARTHGVDVAAPVTSAVCSSRRKLGMLWLFPSRGGGEPLAARTAAAPTISSFAAKRSVRSRLSSGVGSEYNKPPQHEGAGSRDLNGPRSTAVLAKLRRHLFATGRPVQHAGALQELVGADIPAGEALGEDALGLLFG